MLYQKFRIKECLTYMIHHLMHVNVSLYNDFEFVLNNSFKVSESVKWIGSVQPVV